MNLTWLSLGWFLVAVLMICMSIYLFRLYRRDKDKRKLMFMIAFLIGPIVYLYLGMGYGHMESVPQLLRNIYHWASLPVLLAISIAVNGNSPRIERF